MPLMLLEKDTVEDLPLPFSFRFLLVKGFCFFECEGKGQIRNFGLYKLK